MNTKCPECKHEAHNHHTDEGKCFKCDCKHSEIKVYRLLLSERDTALEEARKVIRRCKITNWDEQAVGLTKFMITDWLAKYGGE